MAKLVADIQQLINTKADAKLRSKLRELQNIIYNGEPYQMLKDIRINIGTPEKPKNISIASILNTDGFEKEIIENNTERYREMEAQLFLSKVESLREDVDSLLENREF